MHGCAQYAQLVMCSFNFLVIKRIKRVYAQLWIKRAKLFQLIKRIKSIDPFN